MADEIQWLHFYDHTGGLNTRYTATSTPIFDATEQLNIETITRGGFRKINGYTRYSEAPILSSGTYLQGTIDPTTESDAWTGGGDATTISFSGGVMTNDESAGATGFQLYYNAEAGFTTGTDAAYEARMSIDDGGTLSGIYVTSICVLDDGTDRFELCAVEVSGTKQIGVLTTTSDRTVAGSYTSLTDHDWTALTRYRVSFDASGNVVVYVNDMTTAFITIAVSSLPASTETSRVAFGSYETATVNSSDWDYVVYTIGATALDTEDITGIYSFVDETGAQEVLITAGTTLRKYNSSNADWTTITGGTAFTDGAIPHFVTWTDPSSSNNAITIITTEDRDTPQKYETGTTKADLGGSPPSGKFCEVYNERLFIANTSGNPGGVFFSALGDPEDRDDGSGTWDTTNDLFQIDRHSHGEVTGLKEVNDRLIIFAEKAIYRLQGWGKGSFLLEQIVNGIGCVASKSIVTGPFGDSRREGVFFRDRDGYYWTDGELGNVVRVSEKILTTIDEQFNDTQVANEAAFRDKRRSLVAWSAALASDTESSRTYALDYINGARRQPDNFFIEGWMPFSFGFKAAGTIQESGADRVLFSDYNGLVFKLNDGTTLDNDADFEAYRTTSWINAGQFHLFKQWRYLLVYLKATGDIDLNVEWGINYQDTFTDSQTINLAGTSDLLGSTFVLGTSKLGTTGLIQAKIPIDISASAIRFKFSTTGEAEPFTVLGYSIGFEIFDWFDSNIDVAVA